MLSLYNVMITWRIYDNSKVTSTHFWDVYFNSNSYFWETTTENMWEVMHSWSLYCRIHVTGISPPTNIYVHLPNFLTVMNLRVTWALHLLHSTSVSHICASGVSKIFSHAKLEAFICCNIFEHMYNQQYQYKYKGGEFHQFPPYNTFIFAQQIYNIT